MNGTSANLGEFPWQAQLITFWDNRHFCGGTLISSKHVLTAAHCMFVPKEKITVITGRLSKSEFEQQEIISKVAEVIIHPDYYHPSLLNNDIALLVLVEPVPFNENIEMACLPLHSKSIHRYMLYYLYRIRILVFFQKNIAIVKWLYLDGEKEVDQT